LLGEPSSTNDLRKIPSTGFASDIPDTLLGLLSPRKALSTECDISDAFFSLDHFFLDQTISPDLFEQVECEQDLDNTPLSLGSDTRIADFDISTVYDIINFHD
jgi:hypothetical protein